MFHSKSRATTESSVVNMQVEKKPPPAKDIESATTTTDPRAQPEDPNIVEYDGPNDPENPKNWSHAYKWTLLMILSGMSLTT